MLQFGKWLGYGAVAIVAVLALLVWAGGGVSWNQEPPYELQQSWGEKGSGPGQFHDPTGVAVSSDEVFVADAHNGRIQVFDKRAAFKRAFGAGVLGRPMNLTIAGDRLYVPDFFNDAVQVFTLDGEHLRRIEAEDGLDSPGGVAVRADGTLLIADTYGQRIVHLAADGKLLQAWGGPGAGPGEFNYPTDVAVAPSGDFYVADGYNDRIQQFSADGEFLRKWGGPFAMNIFGPFKGWFATVTSVAVGPDGAVYAADFYNDRIQKFTAGGSFLTAFGAPARAPGQSEFALAVDADGSVWTANFADHRVEQWRPAEQP